MPKTSFLPLLILLPLSLLGQELLRLPLREQKSVPRVKVLDQFRNSVQQRDHPVSVPLQSNFLNQETILGVTQYDLQTNAASQNRIVAGEDGYKAGVWMHSQTFDLSYPDRGTGFNEYVDGNWSARPDLRLESTRTGWPSLTRLSDGTLHIVTHTGGQNLLSLRREAGSASWVETEIPNNTPEGLLWPRSASGGPDGLSIHVLALTTPVDDLGGQEYLGMNGHPLYYRSLDGGLTWDKTDVVIPGLDSTNYYEIEGDTYAIAARDNTVAIAVFGIWGDISLYKSFDNGDTWERTVVNDFPLDKYQVDDGYTQDDIPEDPFAPSLLSIYTSDGSGGLALDQDGLAHITYADAYVQDSVLDDSTSRFYPGWSGISYWNETMLQPALVASLLDYNNNDTIDLTFNSIARYGNGTTTSMPVITTDEKGGVYIVYSAVAEAYYNELDEQNYRHLLTVKSVDQGQNWGPAYDIINPEFSDPEAFEVFETVFPSVASFVDDTLHILYQQDFFPGYLAIDVDDMPAENYAVYTGIPVSFVPNAASVAVKNAQLIDFSVFPNPVKNSLTVELDANLDENKFLEIFNAQGQRLGEWRSTDTKTSLDLSQFIDGIYVLKITAKNKVGYKSLIKG